MFVAKYEHSRPMPVTKDSKGYKRKSNNRRETGVAVADRGMTQGQAGLDEHEDGSAWVRPCDLMGVVVIQKPTLSNVCWM